MEHSAAVALTGQANGRVTEWFVDGVARRLQARGHGVDRRGPSDDGMDGDVRVVLNAVDPAAPRGFRRRSQDIFVVGIAELAEPPGDVLAAGYSLLVRSLSNVFIPIVRTRDGSVAYFITMEQGFHRFPPMDDEDAFFTAVIERLIPLVDSRLVIDNEFHPDLPEALWNGDEHTEAMYRTGLYLAELDLLPAPWPIDKLLSEEDMRHVKRLFGIGGLSYGNVSARHEGERFWMSASGVDKSHLREIGTEICFVTGYDEERGVIHLSHPPHVADPRRVSVDAVEHVMIYREHPEIGAIVHVHGWMEGIASTETVYPCGTHELAEEVAALIRQEPEPGRAVIGMKNHGVTVTGPSLDEILGRITGKIHRQVPMA
jgi:ribulose-5-phosphate 4-epimerase/fuculose-1-phosphate aldolase